MSTQYHEPTSELSPLGCLAIPKKQAQKDVRWGLREVPPLVEVRIPFNLNQLEIDDVTRGSAELMVGLPDRPDRTQRHCTYTGIFHSGLEIDRRVL